MKHLALLALLTLFTVATFADGTVSNPPAAAPLSSYSYAAVAYNLDATPPNITIVVKWYRSDASLAETQRIEFTGAVGLRNIYQAINTPVAGEPTGTTLVIYAKQLRMRLDAYLIGAGLLKFNGQVVTLVPEP